MIEDEAVQRLIRIILSNMEYGDKPEDVEVVATELDELDEVVTMLVDSEVLEVVVLDTTEDSELELEEELESMTAAALAPTSAF